MEYFALYSTLGTAQAVQLLIKIVRTVLIKIANQNCT